MKITVTANNIADRKDRLEKLELITTAISTDGTEDIANQYFSTVRYGDEAIALQSLKDLLLSAYWAGADTQQKMGILAERST